MKRPNLILSILVAVGIVSPAMASINSRQTARSIYDARENDRLDEIQALLERLSEMGALQVDENQDVKVEKSVLDKLRAQGRVNQQFAGGSTGLCD